MLKKLFCSCDSEIDQKDILDLNLIVLYAAGNKKINNVNHMKETLNCGYNCGIDQNGISELNLIHLNASDNKKIKNVNHLKKTQVARDGQKPCLLKILYCVNDSGIDQNGIAELNLIELYAGGNEKIKNVNHMKKTQVARDGHKSSAC